MGTINFENTKVSGFDKTLILNHVGYVARPVTVTKTTVSGLTPTDTGRYIIPQGTYLTGESGSLLDNPQQNAVAVVPTESNATVTINSAVDIQVKLSGTYGYIFKLVKASEPSPTVPADAAISGTIEYTAATKLFTITLAVDKNSNVITTYNDVVALINNDTVANTYVIASLHNGVDGYTKAAATTTLTGTLTQTTSLSSTGSVAKSGTFTGTANETIYAKVTTAPTAAGDVAGMVVSTSTNGTSYTAQSAFTTGTSGSVTVDGVVFTFTLATGQTFVVNEIYTVAAYIAPTTTGGGAESVSGTIDGILVNSIEVTRGAGVGAMMIAGYVNIDNMPYEPGTAVKAALPHITFGRID